MNRSFGIIITFLVSALGICFGVYFSGVKTPYSITICVLLGFILFGYIIYEVTKHAAEKNQEIYYLYKPIIASIPISICLFIFSQSFGDVNNNKNQNTEDYKDETKKAYNTVKNFHEAINNGRCSDAYAMFTSRYKSAVRGRNSLEKSTESCKSTKNIHIEVVKF